MCGPICMEITIASKKDEREREMCIDDERERRVLGLLEYMRVMGEHPQAWSKGWVSLHIKLECLCVWR